MSLTLITGPANAAKAGAVLERLRAALPREPLLVVPTVADVEHYQRELAAGGIVFGADVATFNHLVREIARRVGVRGRPLGRVARDRLVRAAIAQARLGPLAASTDSPGFGAAAGQLFAELQRSLVTPARFTQALRAWAGESGTAAYAEDLAALYSGYRRLLEQHRWLDPEGHAWAALDALRERPAAWGSRPVLMYGFDDLSPLQLDAVETLVARAETEVCVALPYEPGRAALAGCAGTVETLKPLADRHLELEDRSEHYAPSSRGALHHLERALFEPGAPRRPPNGAVRLLEAGGERAEAELVGAEVLELMRQGVAPDDIAILVRGPGTALIAQVLTAYDIPVHEDRAPRLADTRLGAGVLAFARAALPDGTADDLLTWLRTPGKLAEPDAADRLEAQVRRGEVRSAAEARALWEATSAGAGGAGGSGPARDRSGEADPGEADPGGAERPLTELDDLVDAAAEGGAEFLDVLEREVAAIWTAPHRRQAAVLDPEDRATAATAATLRQAASDLRSLAAADPQLLGDPGEVVAALGRVRVWTGSGDPGGVLIADPLAIRARRFRAVFVCGLQHGEFPRAGVPEPFLGDDDRRELARATGLRLPPHEDVVARERSLFYACVSRPEEALFLSWRSSNEEGDPQLVSPFVDDVRALFTDELWTQRGRRLLAEVTWTPRDAPTPHELRRALAAASPTADEPEPLSAPVTDAVLTLLSQRRREAARGLETFAACGVRWLIESLLRPRRIDPDPDPMRRGSQAHAVLERTLRALRERTGSARLTPERLPDALAELDRALARLAPRRAAAATIQRRALEVDLRRYLRQEAEHGAAFEPAHLEWSFGGERDEQRALQLDGIDVSGRVDRIDVGPDGAAIVRDYKGRTVHAGARWTEDQRLQVALYALAVRELLGLTPVAGVYQPLAGRELRPRGLVSAGVEGDYVRTDVVDAGEFEAALAAARELALETATALRAGRIRPCPARCSRDGCAHPTICRASR